MRFTTEKLIWWRAVMTATPWKRTLSEIRKLPEVVDREGIEPSRRGV